MRIGTKKSTQEPLVFENETFTIGDTAILVQEVIGLDISGDISWLSEEARAWFKATYTSVLPSAANNKPENPMISSDKPNEQRTIVGTVLGANSQVTFENGQFLIGEKPTTANKLVEYDSLGVMSWASPEMKVLIFGMQNNPQPTPSAEAPHTGGYPTPSSRAYPPPQAAVQPVVQSQFGFTGVREGRTYINGIDITNEPPYWQEEFKKMHDSNGTYKGKFNWSAFLAGGFWPLAKGMPVVGLIWIAICLLLSWTFIAPIAIWIIAGIRGNYIRYRTLIEKVPTYF